MKKQHREQRDKPEKPQAAPTFRPLEGALKALAQKKKEEDAAAKKAAVAAPTKTPAKGNAPPPKTKTTTASAPAARPSTLTAAERRELESMTPISRDDEFFFQRLMSGVKPLDEAKQGRVTTAPEVKPRKVELQQNVQAAEAAADDEVRDHLMHLVEGATRFEVTDDGARLAGRRLDLGTSTWRRLRLGELPVDSRLDLHGKTADEARATLDEFLRERRTRRDRVVLVIHGRGEHSPGGVGVLRGEIAAWLSQGRASQHVAAFATARRDDGGEGALYVLLRP